ncbi:2-keto-4-pentenoate hydratase/2-oxohepta-3-ene-1,7-dioic acid hydratase (catechol pathway) [Cupriavidus necator]|uniref:2-Keto-4-pentenoate hydratase/2-oxohepta-3-ene-1,7-dioic acid hydratase n=1 Tax=Cupriavidus necator (strain ATCC 17699 / DSM 428 / KCTC 22496 / NCIMB 10442 / H16 / Stanier 337) TaxID=381666 RepID=Q0KFJ7_CUPNH|nr:fumarylacetoacetate hydrolase family protein [Cupriavidus necator]KUE88272.1 2-hydroxyhepta-2,4-diene-1,7-dioate isomerase [Cupriavidus necator]QCB99189.1 FAA hydrolase family protein [Cupriavidus necator H16]QQB77994.1 fumarylacetoacetate hydrolase family protein [Cupriavidus necator]WKA41014.1 fumarylacetoacetate hydrolase family protein [Cupriavidus necator]CAJ91224.1 2-Keto-4-pentenoate hydratase/2-oxohepta-3-ene-1,7-dioic acid hydratase [Cupriavidus necator H16]
MKLVRVGNPGAERPGMIDAQGRVRDLSGVVADIGALQLAPAALARLAQVDPASLPVIEGARFGVPWSGVGKIVAIGLNYADHAAEAGMPLPAEPIVFLKANSSLNGPNDVVMLPLGSEKTDWEVELGVVIGSTARNVSREAALNHVAGYCVVNDVSEREFQIERGGTWDKGKGCDTFCPAGPWLVTRDEVQDPQALGLWLEVNGERVQKGSTATMVFDVATVVSYVSRFMTLLPGDLIATGTPPGVGMGFKPPRFLKAGDTMRLGVDGLGEQTQQVVPYGEL